MEVIWSKPLMLCEYPTGNHLIKDNAEPSLLNVEPAINSGDWRIQLPLDSRQKNIDKLYVRYIFFFFCFCYKRFVIVVP